MPRDGRHQEAAGGLDKPEAVFRVNGRIYRAEVTVQVTDHGRMFYDMTKFRDITSRENDQTPNGAAKTADNASESILSQQTPKVNAETASGPPQAVLPMAGEASAFNADNRRTPLRRHIERSTSNGDHRNAGRGGRHLGR